MKMLKWADTEIENADGTVTIYRRIVGGIRRPRVCPGSGRRTQATGSSAFPEVRCPRCERYVVPVVKEWETTIRSHAPLGVISDG